LFFQHQLLLLLLFLQSLLFADLLFQRLPLTNLLIPLLLLLFPLLLLLPLDLFPQLLLPLLLLLFPLLLLLPLDLFPQLLLPLLLLLPLDLFPQLLLPLHLLPLLLLLHSVLLICCTQNRHRTTTTTLLLHPFNDLSRTTCLSQYQKGKTSLDLNQARNGGFWDAVASAGPHADNLHLAPDR